MPRLPSLTPRRLLRMLIARGFVEDHRTGSHVVLWSPATNRRVVVPMHSRDVPKGTLHAILKQAGTSLD
jgi:predicted RNA binding protein YcfA (HicA-like mRNA interferase family)